MDLLSLDIDALVEEAREKVDLRDFGDESFREPLGVLVDALENEANLNDVGRGTQHARIVDSLATRLMTEDYIRRHPEILEEDLGEPIVIVGLARTGTTRLHRLLGSGPAFQVARWWEVRYPAPFPGSDWRREDPRIAAAHAEVKATLEAVPALAAVHPWDPEGADEEVMLLEHTFLSWVPESAAHVPSYQRWLNAQDLTDAYRYLARFLRFVQWQKKESGRGGGRWILKSPFHLAYIDPLFEVFPGGRVIQTHRDPLETIPSAASMYRSLHALNTDVVDSHWVGEAVRSRYHAALERCMRARERYAPERFIDVDYRAVGRDAIGEARRIYEWLGLELTGDAERAMRQWSQDNARERRAAHEYTLEEFGFTREGLASDFAEYRQRHIPD
ncbi:MAG: sulfotransferase [Myxococcota bacterium]|nr:sulfotransferase [Myxococcota bacterium]